ncbi:MAG: hypothetical protein RLZZ479_1425, partial [Bacteroidota bacterium]
NKIKKPLNIAGFLFYEVILNFQQMNLLMYII